MAKVVAKADVGSKIPVISLEGKKVEEVALPAQFSEQVRSDIIQRAFLSYWSNQRQAYGTDPEAGMRTTAEMKTLRRAYGAWTGRGIARLARIRWGSGHMTGKVRGSPHAVKGRHATPPHAERVWSQKINNKERKKAIRSALAATAQKPIVLARGHNADKIEILPIVVEDRLQTLKKSKDVCGFLEKIGVTEELERAALKKVRAGKGKVRSRRYKRRVGPLVVVAEDKGIVKAARNLPGVDVVQVQNLNANLLAPGAKAGRLTIFTKAALQRLETEKLFM